MRLGVSAFRQCHTKNNEEERGEYASRTRKKRRGWAQSSLRPEAAYWSSGDSRTQAPERRRRRRSEQHPPEKTSGKTCQQCRDEPLSISMEAQKARRRRTQKSQLKRQHLAEMYCHPKQHMLMTIRVEYAAQNTRYSPDAGEKKYGRQQRIGSSLTRASQRTENNKRAPAHLNDNHLAPYPPKASQKEMPSQGVVQVIQAARRTSVHASVLPTASASKKKWYTRKGVNR